MRVLDERLQNHRAACEVERYVKSLTRARKEALVARDLSSNREGDKKVATIKIKTTDRGDSYEFEVTVKEGLGETHHRVTLRKGDYERLSGARPALRH